MRQRVRRQAQKYSARKNRLLLIWPRPTREPAWPRADMKAYEDLNKSLPAPFASNKVRLDEGHLRGESHSQVPHGHVGPVDHITIMDP